MEETITKIPNLPTSHEEVRAAIQADVPTVQQFKNSLKFVQGGTNWSLDRMINQLDVVAAQCFLAGVQAGLAYAKSQVGTGEEDVSKVPNPVTVPVGTFRPAGEVKKEGDEPK
jgi:hypothetical protein